MINTRILATSIPIGVLAVALYLLEGQPDIPAIALGDFGFLEIRPATQLTGPGTFVAVDKKTENYVMVHPLCNMDSAKLASLWQQSPGVAKELAREYKIGANFLERAGLQFGGHAVKEIDIVFENTYVFFLTGENRIKLEKEYLKDDCLQAVQEASSIEKLCVTQPFSEFQADIRYRVKFSDDITIDDKKKILGQVSVHAGGSSDSGDTISGKGLFIGMKLNKWCIVPNDEQHDRVGKNLQDLAMRKVVVRR
jgi:hypothetical protein